MNLELDDDVAVIIGAASGIGLATARVFLNEGVHVCGIDIDSNIESIMANLAKQHPSTTDAPSCIGLHADATDRQAIESVAKKVHEQFARCDHVVFSAACGSGKFGFPFWNIDPADWIRVLEVNLVGAVNVATVFGPVLERAGRGSICLISSVAGQTGSQTDPPYSASKAGLINFGQCAAKDLAPAGVRVNIVSPGMVATPLNRSVWEAWRAASNENKLTYEEWGAQKCQQIAPLGRWQTADEMASVVAFLASDRARNITGQTINVDGGQWMHS